MKTYSVKQIADMIETNPETVRRWIRDKKLNAIQVSRKDGNIVTEDELQRFLKATPKYIAKLPISLAAMSPALGVAALASGIMVVAFAGYYDKKSKIEVRVLPEDFEKYLKESIVQREESTNRKRASIQQIEKEITEEQQQIEQYKYLLEHSDLLANIGKPSAQEPVNTSINEEEQDG